MSPGVVMSHIAEGVIYYPRLRRV